MAALAAFARGQDVGGPISQMMGPGAAAAAAGGPPMPAVPQAGSGASSDGGAVAASARQVRSELDVLANALPPDPWWGQRFWRRIAELDAGGQLAPAVRAALQAKGYVGVATTGAPDVASLRVVFQGLEASAASGLSLGAMVPGGGHAESSSIDAWAHGLPPDFRRAAGEIYRNIRGAGVLSVRQWLTENHTGPKTSDAWQHLWAMATSIDFKIGGISSDQELYQLLNTDDNLELALRHLSAHVYEQRTKDYVGGARLRAVAAPGSQVDIAPGWLIGEATLHSKLEHQREERVQAELRRRQPKGDPKGGKPPKGGGRGGKRAAATGEQSWQPGTVPRQPDRRLRLPGGGHRQGVPHRDACPPCVRGPPPSRPALSRGEPVPTVEEVAEAFQRRETCMPIPLLPPPAASTAKSGRLRQRAARRRAVCKAANQLIEGINRTYAGTMRQPAGGRARRLDRRGDGSATGLAQLRAVRLAQESAHVRRPERVTGVQALRGLLKLGEVSYTGSKRTAVHVPFESALIDEVVTHRVVHMLDALPECEAAFYQDEANVIDWTGKSVIMKEELEQHYGFLGGSESEWIKYHHRADLPPGLWDHRTLARRGGPRVLARSARRTRASRGS